MACPSSGVAILHFQEAAGHNEATWGPGEASTCVCLRAFGLGLTSPQEFPSMQTDKGLESESGRWKGQSSWDSAPSPAGRGSLTSSHTRTLPLVQVRGVPSSCTSIRALLTVSAARPESTLRPPHPSCEVLEEQAMLAALNQALSQGGSLPPSEETPLPPSLWAVH